MRISSLHVDVARRIAGPAEGPGNGPGDGGHRLDECLLTDARTGYGGAATGLAGANRDVMDGLLSTGAVVVGRRTFELAGGWGGDHHDGVPIFVLSRRPPDARMPWPAVTYVSDVKSAIQRAPDAAGGKDVWSTGTHRSAGAHCRGARRGADPSVPVLLDQGRRLFEDMPPEHIELKPLRAEDGPGIEHLPARAT